MPIRRFQTLSPDDPACYVISSTANTFLTQSGQFSSLDAARLMTKDAAAYAMRDAYRAMVNYVKLSVVRLPESSYRQFFYS